MQHNSRQVNYIALATTRTDLSGSFSLINAGSDFHCLYSFLYFFPEQIGGAVKGIGTACSNMAAQ
jgi:hypothetical protein